MDQQAHGRWVIRYLAVAYLGWLAYRYLGQGVTLTPVLAPQNVFFATSAVLITVVILMSLNSSESIVVPLPFIVFASVFCLALASSLWTVTPAATLASIKFDLLFLGAFFAICNTVQYTYSRRQWIQYILALAILNLTVIALYYMFGRGLRHPNAAFSPPVNVHIFISLIVIPFAVHTSYYGRTVFRRYGAGALTFASVLGLLALQSRLSLIALPVILGGLLTVNHGQLVGWRRSRLVAGLAFTAGLLGVGGLLIVIPDLLGRVIRVTLMEIESAKLALDGAASFMELSPRIRIYTFALSVLADPGTWLTGVGYGGFRVLMESQTGWGKVPHSPFLRFLLETGILGVSLVIIAWVLPLRYAIYAARFHPSARQRSVGAAVAWAYVMVSVFYLFQPFGTLFPFFLLVALSTGIYNATTMTEKSAGRTVWDNSIIVNWCQNMWQRAVLNSRFAYASKAAGRVWGTSVTRDVCLRLRTAVITSQIIGTVFFKEQLEDHSND